MPLKAGRGRKFYAVGGTWRALARIHIIQSGYPLKVMHGYSIPAAEALVSRGGCGFWLRPASWPISKSWPTRGGRC